MRGLSHLETYTLLRISCHIKDVWKKHKIYFKNVQLLIVQPYCKICSATKIVWELQIELCECNKEEKKVKDIWRKQNMGRVGVLNMIKGLCEV